MIWILSVETQRVHRKIFIHYVFTSRNRSGGEKSEFFWVRISANEQQLDHMWLNLSVAIHVMIESEIAIVLNILQIVLR